MQHVSAPWLSAYHARLQSDHDYRVWAELLDLEEEPVDGVPLTVLDGQVNLLDNDEGPKRTATLALSDPDNATNFGLSFTADPTGTLWANRLVRIKHSIVVPDVGEVESTVFVGLPTAVSRTGGEVGLELGDKSLLCDYGRPSITLRKGLNARTAIIECLEGLTGEKHHRIPATTRTLSKDYSISLSNAEDTVTTPWRLARLIANNECAWRLDFTADGWAVAEPRDGQRAQVQVAAVLDLPNPTATFEFINYAKVSGGNNWSAIGELPDADQLSSWSLRRHGVRRYRAIYVEDAAHNTSAKVTDRATKEIKDGGKIESTQAHSIIPMFHLDNDDEIVLPDGTVLPFTEGSIPLGAGGPMSVGGLLWVSKPTVVKTTSSQAKKAKKKKRKKR